MSDKNPCPFCGDDSEYLRFLDLCAERANEIWRENEVKILTDVCKAMDSAQVVRCRDCKFFNDLHGLCHRPVLIVDGIRNTRWVDGSDETEPICATAAKPDDFCAWGKNERDVQ